MRAFTLEYVISQIFVIISYVFLISSYQLKTRRIIVVYSMASIITYGIAYIFMQEYTGLAMSFVALIRNIIFLIDEKKNGKTEKIMVKDIFVLLFLTIISIIFAIYTYNGFFSLLCVFATILYTYSVWQKKTSVYKILGLPIGIIWIAYNVYIMSIVGIILETIIAASAIYGYYKEKRNKPQIVGEEELRDR